MGELTEVASAKRGVRGDLRETLESPESLRLGAGVTVTSGAFLFSPAIVAVYANRSSNERRYLLDQMRLALYRYRDR